MLHDVIIQQKYERDKLISSDYIERNQHLEISSGLINIIIGPRRAGKSFFALHSLAEQNFGYVNFDDERLIEIRNYDELINAVETVYSNPKILLFDEIQNLPKWELFVNRLQRNGKKIVLTGSNSNLLSGELSTHLTGRNYIVNIFPFSFNELLNASEINSETIRKKIIYTLLNDGGYPEIIAKEIPPSEYLKMLFRDTIYKDIILRYKPRDPNMANKIAITLINNAGSETSVRQLSRLVKYNERTVSKYLRYLFETMLFFQIPKFSYKLKEQLSSQKKTYVIDNGFIESVGFNISGNLGKKLENLVATELYRRTFTTEEKLFYWKEKYEVDFVIFSENSVKGLIQVSANVENIKTIQREKRALIEAANKLNCDNLIVVTENYSAEEYFEWYGTKKKIQFIKIDDWLLNNGVSA